MRTFVLVNPMSGGGATGRRWPDLRRALSGVLEDWDHGFTLEPHDATRMAAEAARDGYVRLVVVGGDGTLNEAVNGLFDREGQPRAPDMVFAPVRFGTGGDFARHLGLPSALPAAVAHLEDGAVAPMDVGVVQFSDPKGAARSRFFVNIASFGLSGEVDRLVNRSSKRLKSAGFALAMGRALISYRPSEVVIEVDGVLAHDGRVVTAAVANGSFFGGGMRFAREAKLDDGRFEIIVQTRAGVKEALRLPDLYSGALREWSAVKVFDGAVVEARPKEEGRTVLLDVDGEQPGALPARFWMLPKALLLQRPAVPPKT